MQNAFTTFEYLRNPPIPGHASSQALAPVYIDNMLLLVPLITQVVAFDVETGGYV